MKFAKTIYYTAAIYGIIALFPQYFLLDKIGRDQPPAITHPEFFLRLHRHRARFSIRVFNHRPQSAQISRFDADFRVGKTEFRRSGCYFILAKPAGNAVVRGGFD